MDGQQPQGGYSRLFYLMLVLGIVGLLGVIVVSAAAAGGW